MIKKLLIANRGEIAIRIARAASDMGIKTVGICSQDDQAALHNRRVDTAVVLEGTGAAAYLDGPQIIQTAIKHQCDGIHPGYGFLSENADFARLCGKHKITFVGPTPAHLSLFGDKSQARLLAESCGVPIIKGTNGDTDLAAAQVFFQQLPPGAQMLIKARAGGGGRGMRIVETIEQLPKLLERCQSEAKAAFGDASVYVEQLVPRARHIEIQIIGDGENICHLWERECSTQRNHQKVIELAPAPGLDPIMRQSLIDAAVTMAASADYLSLGTFEFLLDRDNPNQFYFIEANPRLQVEHTVTEAVTGVDLVQTQLHLANGETLATLGLLDSDRPLPRGFAIQARINMESLSLKTPANPRFKPTGGTLAVFEPPTGPGIRVDSFGYAGYQTSTRFDSLLAKLIVHSGSPEFVDCARKTYRALTEFRIEGFDTNIPFLMNLVQSEAFKTNDIYTRFVDENLPALAIQTEHEALYFSSIHSASAASVETADSHKLAGSKLTSRDPLAVLNHGKSTPELVIEIQAEQRQGPIGTTAVNAPVQGTVIELSVEQGSTVYVGQQLAIMEAMKMEHVITAPISGIIKLLACSEGDAVFDGHQLLFIEPGDVVNAEAEVAVAFDPDHIRPDLAESIARHALGLDSARPEAVAKRHGTGHRTVRENLKDLYDPDTFVEYGALTIAAQRRRRKVDDLMRNTPADGMVTGIGSVNGDLFPTQETQCILMSYDYMVLAGTQGGQNHRKKDRMFELAETLKLPIILIAEGGGGRPGDTDGLGIAGLDCLAFALFGKLSGLVPRIGITTGRCFAGNAALLGASDVVIATKDSNIGMGGPAMIEGGGLGIFTPDEVGPMSVQVSNGVVDIVVEDEAEAMVVAKKYLSYFQGRVDQWEHHDQRPLRAIIPENRLRIYDIRELIETLADVDSVLELRAGFGLGMITALARIEGRPVGIIANNPAFLSGAIDSHGADKAARFMQLCDAFDIPILSLCDTPGIMVGPEAEKTALVRHAARMFVTGSSITVPLFTIVLRKGYGLGAQAMAGGGFKASIFTVTWPTGEFGGMGLEGAVKLGYRKELEAIEDPDERAAAFETRVASMYQHGKAVNYATAFEIDDVIDPVESRQWILAGLKSTPAVVPRHGKKRPFVDTW
ncbi:carbamoyl-phosphate synthase large subunit [Pseudomonadales bacterium]|nr:carbamoyl-phosphate synthase large subunit [Pseudomonadales bacterium]